MARLPDINVDMWLADQQRRFERATSGLFPALEFKAATTELNANIPPDWPVDGGSEALDLLRQQNADDERRLQEQADEQAREQQRQQDQIAEQQRVDALTEQARAEASRVGIPAPTDMLSMFKAAEGTPAGTGDHLATTGALSNIPSPASAPDVPVPQVPPSPADTFTKMASNLQASVFGPPEEPVIPDSTTSLFPELGPGDGAYLPTLPQPDELNREVGGALPGREYPINTPGRQRQVGPPAPMPLAPGRELDRPVNYQGDPELVPPPRAMYRQPLTDSSTDLPAPDSSATTLPSPDPLAVESSVTAEKADPWDTVVSALRHAVESAVTPKQRSVEEVDQQIAERKATLAEPIMTEAGREASTPAIRLLGRGIDAYNRSDISKPFDWLLQQERTESRKNDLDTAANTWIQEQGREPLPDHPFRKATDDPEWQAAHPEEANELEEARRQELFDVGGTSSGVTKASGLVAKSVKALGKEGFEAAVRQFGREPVLRKLDEEGGLAQIRRAIAIDAPLPRLPSDAAVRAAEEAVPQRPLPGMEDLVRPPVAPLEGVSDDAARIVNDVRAEHVERHRVKPLEEMRGDAELALLDERSIRARQRAALDPRNQKGTEGLELSMLKEADVRAFDAANEKLKELRKLIPTGKSEADMAGTELGDALAQLGVDVAHLEQQVGASAGAESAKKTAIGRQLVAFRALFSSQQAYRLSQRGQRLADDLMSAAETVLERVKTGGGKLTSEDQEILRQTRNRLSKDGDTVFEGASSASRLVDDIQVPRPGGKKAAAEAAAAAKKPPPHPEESFAEKLGRLKREAGMALEDGLPEKAEAIQREVDRILTEVSLDGAERAQKAVNKSRTPLTTEQAERAINESIGRRAVSRIRSEAMGQATGRSQGQFLSQFDRDIGKKIDAALTKHTAEAASLTRSIDLQVQRRIEAALRQEERTAVRNEVRQMSYTARDWMKRILDMPNQPALHEELDAVLGRMSEHSNVGEQAAKTLRETLANQLDTKSFQHLSTIEKRNMDNLRQRDAAATRTILKGQIRSLVDKIDTVLDNPEAPGAMNRLQELHADLWGLGKQGMERSSGIREKLMKKGLLQSGMAKDTPDQANILAMLQHVNPDDPASWKPVLKAISNPGLWAVFREMQYVNMLSSPLTHLMNIESNVLQTTGRLLLNNPLEFIGSMGESTGTGAALSRVWSASEEGRGLAGSIMRTGTNPIQVERALETGNMRSMNRELLSELPGAAGKVGEAMHWFSSRPLEAMDAWIGHVAYAATVEQKAVQTAEKLLKEGSRRVKDADGVLMSHADAVRFIKGNVWDFPEVIAAAGKVKDYTLLKTRGGSSAEQRLRALISLRSAGGNLEASTSDKIWGGAIELFLPFFNVPLNFAKQGFDRSVMAVPNLGRAGYKLAKGEKAEAGELFARGATGALALGTAVGLIMNDSLTGDGPSDADDRALWLQSHRPNSFRLPGTDQWISWQGLPFALPFAMVAGVGESVHEARQKAESKGLPLTDTGVRVAAGMYQGAVSGLMSQSFLQGLADQFKIFTGVDARLTNVSQTAASLTGRYLIPGSGMLGFLAQVTDGMDRDAGRPQTSEDLPQNIGARIASRIPGLREQLTPRINAYGEDQKNVRSLDIAGRSVYESLRDIPGTRQRILDNPVGAIQSGLGSLAPSIEPHYRGEPPYANDPITKTLEDFSVGMPAPPTELTLHGFPVPITMKEQQEFAKVYGQTFRAILEEEQTRGETYTAEQYGILRGLARKVAQNTVLDGIGTDEIERRMKPAIERETAAPRR